jgi:hypothetical protein
MNNIKKAISYVMTFIYFQLGKSFAWLMMEDWTQNGISQCYLYCMEKACDWQDWGGINYPWKDEINDENK